MIPSFRLPYSLQSIRDAIPLQGHRPSWHEFELATLSDPHWLPCLVDLPIAPVSMRMGRCLCHDARYARHGEDTDSLAQAAQLVLVARGLAAAITPWINSHPSELHSCHRNPSALLVW